MKFILPSFLLLLLSLPASAQVAVSGNVQDVGVANVTSGMQVTFELQNFGGAIPRVPGGPVIGRVLKGFNTDSSGNFTGSLYPNSVIEPQGTWYRVCVVNLGQELRCNKYLINGPFNLSTAVPITPSTNIGPNQFITESFPFTQLTPATTWTVTHNFNDSGTVVFVKSTAGDQIFPDKVNCHTDRNSCVLTFVTPTAGFAIAMHAGAINVATNQQNAIISNPVGAQTVIGNQAISFQGPASFSNTLAATNPGSFLVGMNEYLTSILNGCNPATENAAEQGGNLSTDGIAACVSTPLGTTNQQVTGVSGYVNTFAPSSGRTIANTAAIAGGARVLGNGGAGWGGRFICQDASGVTGGNCVGVEIDGNFVGPGTGGFYRGLSIIECATCVAGSTGAAPTDSIMLELTRSDAVAQSTRGIWLRRGTVNPSTGTGLELDGLSSNPSTNSNRIAFDAYDGANVIQQSSILGNPTAIQINPPIGGAYFFSNSGGGLQFPGSTSGFNILQAPAIAGSTTTVLPKSGGTLLSTGNGAGNLIQTQRTASCSTAAPANSVCSTTVTWSNPFADANYTVSCSLVNANQAQAGITHVSGAPIAASVSVEISNFSVATAASGTLHCTAHHD